MTKLNGSAKWAGVIVAAMMLTFVITRALSGDYDELDKRVYIQEKNIAVIMEKLTAISDDIIDSMDIEVFMELFGACVQTYTVSETVEKN